MEQVNIAYYPITVNLDVALEKLKPTEARFLKGTRITLSRNSASQSTNGTVGVTTPIESNELYFEDLVLPSGDNKTVGAFEFQELNEFYWIVWNSNYNHSVYVIDGLKESCQLVYKGSCLDLSLAPEHYIAEHRCYIKVEYTEIDGIQTVKEKYFIYTDGNGYQRQINVIASIGSNSFTTPYFAPVAPHYETCSYVTLPAVAPMYRPKWELIPRVEDPNTHEPVDKDEPNKLFNKAIQIAYDFTYIDGRRSSVSLYSMPIIVGGTDCSEQNPDILPRCASVDFWVGTAFVNDINIYTRECVDCPTGDCSGNWVLYDTIHKHKCDADNPKWWERTDGWGEYDYDSSDNTITYTFCNNKECMPVDQNIFTHIENEVPFKSKALVSVGDRLALGNNLRGSYNLNCEEVEYFDVTVEPQPDESCVVPKREITIYMIIRNYSTDGKGNGNECGFLYGDSSSGSNKPIDGRYYFGAMGYRDKPLGGMAVAIDEFWKSYQQYVPAIIEDDITGGFVGYFAGTSFSSVSKQVKLSLDNCSVSDLGIIYNDITKASKGSFDSIVEDLKNGQYVVLQQFKFTDVPAGKYCFRVGGHRSGMDLDFEKTSTYIYGNEINSGCATGGDFSPSIKNNYELIVDCCEYDYDSLQEGLFVKLLDLTYPDFEDDRRNVIDYNLVREFYLFEDDDYSVPFEKQQIDFEFGYFTDKITNRKIWIDGFEDDGTGLPVYLIDPWTVNIAGLIVPIPCPPAPLLPLAGYLRTPSGVSPTTLRLTDHNGFGFHVEHFWRWRIFYNTLNCSPFFDMTAQFGEPKLGALSISYVDGCSLSTSTISIGVSQISPPVTALSNKGYKGLLGTVSKSTGTIDNLCNRIRLHGAIMDLEGNRLTGVNVGFSESQFVRTDGFGNFRVDVHQDTAYAREGYFMISNSGNSCLVVCNEECEVCCDVMFQEKDLSGLCGSEGEGCEGITIEIGDIEFKRANFPDKGLKGRYGVGVIGFDLYGRVVTGGANRLKYIETPQCWDKHPEIHFLYNGGVLPYEIKYMTLLRTANLNGTITQWIADKFILIDENGNETSSRGRAVALAIDMQSLLDYNTQHNLGTNVTYSFVKGDMVKIVDNCENPIIYQITGDTFGTLSETALQQELSITTNGSTATTTTNVALKNGGRIIIAYDSRMDEYLDKCNIKIEIISPYQCDISLTPYGEISDSYPCINGQLGISDEIIETWDTYKIFRTIPRKADCGENPNDESYFSNNITDFWGKGCNDLGRKFSENPYAERRWNQNELASSKSFVNNGVVNGLATFWDEDVKNFKSQNFGGIVAAHAQRNIILFICENDYFVTGFDQNYLTVTDSGTVQAFLPDKITEPSQKVGMAYGCSYEHTATIVIYDGMIYYLDAKNGAYIQNNYSEAKDISLNAFKGHLQDKIMYAQSYNESIKGQDNYLHDIYEFVGGVCPLYKEVFLTIRNRNGLSSSVDDFTSINRDVFVDENETFVISHPSGAFVNLRASVPEFYGKLRTSSSGIQLIQFKNGVPYKCNNTNTSYSTFFGKKVTPVIEVSANNTDSKIKIFEAVTEEVMPFALFVDRIKTEEKNSFSYIPQSGFKRKENMQYACVLRDMSSYFDSNKYQESMLFDGKRLFGRYALIRFALTEENEDKYFELNRIWALVSGSELSMKPQVANE